MIYDVVARPLDGIDLCAIYFFRIEIFTIAFLVFIGIYGVFLSIVIANKVAPVVRTAIVRKAIAVVVICFLLISMVIIVLYL